MYSCRAARNAHAHVSFEDYDGQSTYRNAEMGPLRPVLDGYPAFAQAKWHAWRTRQNLEDRLPADFHEVLESALVYTDGLFDTTRTSQADSWSLSVGFNDLLDWVGVPGKHRGPDPRIVSRLHDGKQSAQESWGEENPSRAQFDASQFLIPRGST